MSGEIPLNHLALMTPRFRAIAVAMARLPVAERRPCFEAWLARQPDAAEIRRAMADVDPYGPCPLPETGAN
jgi:hypothetical protein